LSEPDSQKEAAAQDHMARLTPNTREALLLHAIEGSCRRRSAQVMGRVTPETATDSSTPPSARWRSRSRPRHGDRGRGDHRHGHLGHRAGDGPPRHRRRPAPGARPCGWHGDQPDLVLADIQLADNSSGIDAVNDILQEFQDLPVIFITAFPSGS
jgi:CheY-like chemotaxis protein